MQNGDLIPKYEELSCIVMTTDVPEYGLKMGDVGTIVMVLEAGKIFDVEFINNEGYTTALVILHVSQIRPALPQDLK